MSTIRTNAIATLLSLLLLSSGSHQDTDKRKIVRATAAFIKDSLPPGGLLVAADLITSQAVEESALLQTELVASRVSVNDAIRCSDTLGSRQCTIHGGSVVLGIGEPRVSATTATIDVAWRYQSAPRTVSSRFLKLELQRSAAGEWTVRKVLARGMS
jgi:hypothetical protein